MPRRTVLLAVSVLCCVAWGSLILSSRLFRVSNPASLSLGDESLSSTEPSGSFGWSELPPGKELNWVKCYPGHQCSRLIVPLDYTEPDGREAVIALIRRPAAVSQDSKLYRGPVLINPGGPGGSGVAMVLVIGGLLSSILGPQFDIVGFDPRGIGHSTPKISFFKTEVERALFNTGSPDIVDLDDGTLSHLLASRKLLNSLAAEQDDGYLRHMNTDYTARDMLRIVEAHGREKLQYWGFSYGTVLGATFAAMFPDKVERIIIDGVVDSEAYYGNDWSSALLDTDKVLDTFFIGCSNAGPDFCPFSAPSPEEVRKNLTAIFMNVKEMPIPTSTASSYGILDYGFLSRRVFFSLYSPYEMFPMLARALAELGAGVDLDSPLFHHPSPFQCKRSNVEETPVPGVYTDALDALVCNDGDYIPSDLDFAKATFFKATNRTEFGGVWSAIVGVKCAGWPKFKRDHIFRGPFVATNTSHPILLIGNTADPVTPLASAKKMSQGFDHSVVLTQNSVGHCSIAAPSVCTLKYIRKYFTEGTLPKEGTVCEPERGPFDPDDLLATGTQTTLTGEDKELMMVANEISKTPFVYRLF